MRLARLPSWNPTDKRVFVFCSESLPQRNGYFSFCPFITAEPASTSSFPTRRACPLPRHATHRLWRSPCLLFLLCPTLFQGQVLTLGLIPGHPSTRSFIRSFSGHFLEGFIDLSGSRAGDILCLFSSPGHLVYADGRVQPVSFDPTKGHVADEHPSRVPVSHESHRTPRSPRLPWAGPSHPRLSPGTRLQRGSGWPPSQWHTDTCRRRGLSRVHRLHVLRVLFGKCKKTHGRNDCYLRAFGV